MFRNSLTVAGLFVALVLFVLVNVLSNATLTGSRLDLTQNKLFTLSQGSRNIVASLEEPITLTYYFSESLVSEVPQIRNYAQRVHGLLDEYAAAGGGKVRLSVHDPEPFSEEEDNAVADGLQGIQINTAGDVLYFGLVASGATDEREVVPFFDPKREKSLEYDISRIITKLGHPQRPVVAVVSSLPLAGQEQMPFPGSPPGKPGWFILDQMRDVFDVRMIDTTAESLPADTNLVLVIHPKLLPDRLLYAIDQFVLKGGNAAVFTDPICEREEVPPDPQNQFAAMTADKSSNFERLYRAWGIEMVPGKFVADREAALQVRAGSQSRPEAVDFVAWLNLGPDHFDRQDFVTADITRLNVPSAGSLKPLEGATTQFTPLIWSSKDSEELDVSSIQFMPDPKKLLAEFAPTGQTYTLAARLRGPVKTAFPEGRPRSLEASPTQPEPADDAPDPDFITDSKGPINVIAVADVDLLWDEWWVQVQNFLGQRLAIPSANNGDFLINSLDNLAGTNDLISVRSRGNFERPFERVDDLRKAAEQRFREQEQALQEKLQEADRHIAELQKQKSEGSSMILSPEQRAEIVRFRDEQVATRKQLRDVRHDLAKDIDALQSRIKVINIGLVPLAVLVAAVGLGSWRARRRRD